jgi:hypothetical protein
LASGGKDSNGKTYQGDREGIGGDQFNKKDNITTYNKAAKKSKGVYMQISFGVQVVIFLDNLT